MPDMQHRDTPAHAVSMPSRVAKMLSQQLALHAPQFQLGNVSFRSFQRKWGYAPGLAASDLVHAVTALLEFEHEPGRPTRTPDDRFLCVQQPSCVILQHVVGFAMPESRSNLVFIRQTPLGQHLEYRAVLSIV